MAQELNYNKQILNARADEIATFSSSFTKEVDYLSKLVGDIEKNLQSEEAAEIYNNLKTVSEQSLDYKEALKVMSDSIKNDIIPYYEAIEAKASKVSMTDSLKDNR